MFHAGQESDSEKDITSLCERNEASSTALQTLSGDLQMFKLPTYTIPLSCPTGIWILVIGPPTSLQDQHLGTSCSLSFCCRAWRQCFCSTWPSNWELSQTETWHKLAEMPTIPRSDISLEAVHVPWITYPSRDPFARSKFTLCFAKIQIL